MWKPASQPPCLDVAHREPSVERVREVVGGRLGGQRSGAGCSGCNDRDGTEENGQDHQSSLLGPNGQMTPTAPQLFWGAACTATAHLDKPESEAPPGSREHNQPLKPHFPHRSRHLLQQRRAKGRVLNNWATRLIKKRPSCLQENVSDGAGEMTRLHDDSISYLPPKDGA